VSSIRSRLLGSLAVLLFAATASAQLPFPPQNPFGPVGPAQQTNYPYPGQCVVDTVANGAWGVPGCTLANAKSFACEPGLSGFPNQSAGG